MAPVEARYRTEDLLGSLNEAERKYAPEELFVAGNTSLLGGQTKISIVGSRKASDLGLARARKLSKMLVNMG